MKYIKWTGLAVMLLTQFSCSKEKELNPSPTSLITNDVAFASKDRVLNQVNGLYATFKGNDFYGSRYIIYSDIRTGDFISANLNPLIGALDYQGQLEAGSPEVNSVWLQGYQIINACNTFLAGMESTGNAVVGDELGAQYNAEARALRAITYYSLLQLYAQPYTKDNGASPGLPLRLTPNEGLQDYSMPRSTVAEVYAQILDDMNYAEGHLPLKYSSDFYNTTRLHRNAVIALKTRIYLSMGDYANVITEADKIVSATAPYTAGANGGVANALEPDIALVFTAPYTTAESIFSVPFTNNDAPGVQLAYYYLPLTADAAGLGTVGSGQYYVYKGGIVASTEWAAADKRRNFIFTTPSGGQTGRLWLTKYRVGSPYTDYAPVIRYAEVLLNLAEALVKENGAAGISRAQSLLEAVRHRSDPSYTFTVTGPDDLVNKIITERHIEFLGEGLRNADIMRLQQDIPGKYPDGGLSVPPIAPGASNYTWPLPNNELLYNSAI